MRKKTVIKFPVDLEEKRKIGHLKSNKLKLYRTKKKRNVLGKFQATTESK